MAQTKIAASSKSTSKPARAKAAAKSPAKSTAKKPAAKKTAKAPAKPAAKPAARKAKADSKVGQTEVKLDRRRDAERRNEEAVETTPVVVAGAALERREKVSRRRQIDPTTCERDYSDGEVEFMNALDAYKRSSGRMFPTCSEVLEVIRDIGYVQLSPAELAMVKAGRGDDATTGQESLEDSAEAEANAAFADSDELHVD